MSYADELAERAKRFAVRVIRFARTLPREPATDSIARQLARAGTGNYRATRRSRSRLEFIARLAVVVEEADETEYWLDVIAEANLSSGPELVWLRQESGELRAIFSTSLSTARLHHKSSNP